MTAREILAKAAGRKLMPTALSSREIAGRIAGEIRERSLWTARGNSAAFLGELGDALDEYLPGDITDAEARKRMLASLDRLGYTPEGGFPGEGAVPPARRGSLRDLGSRKRLQLILDTQRKIVFGMGQKAAGQAPDSAYRFPAWELVRVSSREVPRGWRVIAGELVPFPDENWPSRWMDAGGILGGEAGDRMVALKGDAIWGRLGDSRLFPDAMDVDVPPFAWGSGMGWRAVPRAECVELGIIAADWEPEGFEAWRMNERLRMGIANMPADIVAGAKKALGARLEGKALKVRVLRDAARERYLNGEAAGRDEP